MKIYQAQPSDHLALSMLTKSSKAHWGYSVGQMEKWDAVLTITEEFIQSNTVYKLCEEDEIIGYYAYINEDATTVTLDSLFLLPDFIGRGLGQLLMDDFIKRVKGAGVATILLEADPHATTFYKRYNFEIIEEKKTDIPGRFLPVMKLVLG